MSKEIRDIHLDIDSIIAIDEINKNNSIAIFTDYSEFYRLLKGVCIADINVSKQLITDIEKVGCLDNPKSLGMTIARIKSTEKLHNIYPLFDIEFLIKFRRSILCGVIEEMETRSLPEIEAEEACKQFWIEELDKCNYLKTGIKRFLGNTQDRIIRYKAKNIVEEYIEFVKKEIQRYTKVEDEKIELTNNQLTPTSNQTTPASNQLITINTTQYNSLNELLNCSPNKRSEIINIINKFWADNPSKRETSKLVMIYRALTKNKIIEENQSKFHNCISDDIKLKTKRAAFNSALGRAEEQNYLTKEIENIMRS